MTNKEQTDNTENYSNKAGMAQNLGAADANVDNSGTGSENEEPRHVPVTLFDKLAVVSIAVALMAWVVLSFNGIAALIVGAVSFVAACFGLKASRRLSRNIAITSLVASSVLMVVVGAFLIVIYIGLSKI